MVNRNRALTLMAISIVVLVGTSILFDFGVIRFFDDEITNTLFCYTMSRAITALLFIFVIKFYYSDRAFYITNGGLKGLLWSVPCILVALANFPYSTLLSGKATIVRSDIMYLYVFYTLATAIYEELVFRGFITLFIFSFFLRNSHKYVFTVLISSAVFALMHTLNFAGGYSVYTLLQIGYTFLIGCMLSSLYLYTKNLFLCMGIHAIFNFGGLLISTLGKGDPWDLVFWILTGVCAAFCATHIIITMIKLDKRNSYVS